MPDQTVSACCVTLLSWTYFSYELWCDIFLVWFWSYWAVIGLTSWTRICIVAACKFLLVKTSGGLLKYKAFQVHVCQALPCALLIKDGYYNFTLMGMLARDSCLFRLDEKQAQSWIWAWNQFHFMSCIKMADYLVQLKCSWDILHELELLSEMKRPLVEALFYACWLVLMYIKLADKPTFYPGDTQEICSRLLVTSCVLLFARILAVL